MGIKSLKILVSLVLIAGFSLQSMVSVCQLARCGNQAIMDCCQTKGDQKSQYKEACCNVKNGDSPVPFSRTSISSSSEICQFQTIQTSFFTPLPNSDLSASLFESHTATSEPSAFRTPILRI